MMKNVKFGWKHASQPTPAKINRAVRLFTVVTGAFIAWMGTTDIMGPQTENLVTSILSLLLGIANGVAPLFGVDLQQQYVDKEDVTAVELPNRE